MSGARPFTPRIEANSAERQSAWEEFSKDERLKRVYDIKPDEMESLRHAALLGNIRSKQDFVFMLHVFRRSRR